MSWVRTKRQRFDVAADSENCSLLLLRSFSPLSNLGRLSVFFFGGVSGSCRRSFLIHGFGLNSRLKSSLPLRCHLGNSPTSSAFKGRPAARLSRKNVLPPP